MYDQKYDEIVVAPDGVNRVFVEENVNVLDYYPSDNLCYFLIKKSKEYWIQLKASSKVVFEKQISSFKPKKLERDFLGNIYIEAKDSAYQIFVQQSGLSFHWTYFFCQTVLTKFALHQLKRLILTQYYGHWKQNNRT